jgi:hypothetical protein
MGKAQVIHVEVGKMPNIRTVDTHYKKLQDLVGGHMEVIFINPKVAMYHHGEGKLIGLEPNFNFLVKAPGEIRIGDVIVGDVFFATHDKEGEMISLTDNMIEDIMHRFIDRHHFLG